MAELIATVTSKGQVTVPAPVRRHLGLRASDKIAFVIKPDGTVLVRAPRYPTLQSLRGAAGRLKRPLTWRRMREIGREDSALGSGERPAGRAAATRRA
ncbi:MAG TPA: type II toxin-antitoxin system PrlF family antitoxin [Chloroflexota bacterium]|nr:type II toxin-antitoxin system PrlF family antitoxin [Chloroflexota bacterium]